MRPDHRRGAVANVHQINMGIGSMICEVIAC
jgi:hypothetical protein